MTSPVTLAAVYLAAALVSGAAAAVIWRRRDVRGARELALMVAAAGFWALCDAVEVSVQGVPARRLVSQIQYLGVVAAAPFFFHAALALAGRERWLTPPVLAAVWGIPLASLVLAWTNAWHHWIWTGITIEPGSPLTVYRYGWWFWLLTAQHYALMAVASVLLVRATRRVRAPFRAPFLAVIVAILVPWLGNAAYVFKLGPVPGFNWLTASLGLSGTLLAWAAAREGLFDLLPAAREAVLEQMTDGVIVLELTGRVVLVNASARRLLEAGHDGRRPLDHLLARIGEPLPAEAAGGSWHGEIELTVGGEGRWIDVRADAVPDRWGQPAGRVLVLRDITTRRAIEDEREALIADLEHALDRIQSLEGLLPICANCRKVRDAGGRWERMDDYLAARVPVEFSHGICPDCAGTLYDGDDDDPASR